MSHQTPLPPHSTAAVSPYLPGRAHFLKNMKFGCPASILLAVALHPQASSHMPTCLTVSTHVVQSPSATNGDTPTSCPHFSAPGHHSLLQPLGTYSRLHSLCDTGLTTLLARPSTQSRSGQCCGHALGVGKTEQWRTGEQAEGGPHIPMCSECSGCIL